MTVSKASILLGVVAVVVSTAAALLFGLSRERAELAWELKRLNQQFLSELSQNVRLASLLARHGDVLETLRDQRNAPGEAEALSRLVIETARTAIVVSDFHGNVIASGMRDPSESPLYETLPTELAQTFDSGLLSRRFVATDEYGWLFEAGKVVADADHAKLGFVVTYLPINDLAETWRAIPDNLRLLASDGRTIYAHSRFQPTERGLLRASAPSLVHGTELMLERSPRVLVAYGFVGLFFGLLLSLALFFGLTSASRRRELAEARINALTSDAAALEARVVERTRDLQEEIEQHKRTGQALQDSQSQLVQTAKLQVLGDMASGLSHELSQPLFALEASLDTLKCQLEIQPDSAGTSLAKAQRVSRRMRQILNNLKAFARKDDDEPELLDLTGPVDASLDILEHEAARHHVTIDHRLPDVPIMGMATPTRLQQVIVNVISNSLHAVPKDGTGRIQITYGPGPQICVTDNGPGFADTNAALKPFETTKKDQNGLGLGLSISADIMRQFGGSVQLDTAPGGGAKVVLSFVAGEGS